MLEEFFLNQVKADFSKAIGKHAKELGVENKDIQIRIKINEKGLGYSLFKKWGCEKQDCSFNDVMHIRLDVFGKEQMLSPYIYEMLIKQISQYDSDAERFSAFLFEHNKTICCALHNGSDYVRTCPLGDLFG
jgi:hypothetical protein